VFLNSAQQVLGTKMRSPIVVDYYVDDDTVHIMSQ
jgi:hypothetical protein